MPIPITTLLGYIEVIEEKANNSMASDVRVRMHAMWGCNVSVLCVLERANCEGVLPNNSFSNLPTDDEHLSLT